MDHLHRGVRDDAGHPAHHSSGRSSSPRGDQNGGAGGVGADMFGRAMIVLICFMGGAGAIARAERYESVPTRTSFALFPMQLNDWRGVQEPPMDDQVLKVLGVTDYLTRAYFRPDKAGVGLYIGYWNSQRQGDTIHSPLNCLPGAGWEPVSKSTIEVPNGIGQDR